MIVCGIDVHKSRAWVHIQENEQMLEQMIIPRTPEGLEDLAEKIVEYEVEKTVMESTNTYWIPIYRRLSTITNCSVINAYQRKILGKHKTDERDASDLATWGLLNVDKASYVPSMGIFELRLLIRTRTKLLVQQTSLVNQIKSLIEGHCPGLTNSLKNMKAKYALAFLHDWRSNNQKSSFDEWIEAQSHFQTRKALKKRQEILGYWWRHPLSNSVQFLVDLHLKQYRFLAKELVALEQKIKEKIPETNLEAAITYISSTPGLGFITSVTLACELGSVERFSCGREAAASCGLTPRLHGSAGRTRAGRITKHGPSSVRRALYISCKTVLRYSPRHREFFQRIKARRGGKIALIALCRKLTELSWSLWKKQSLYTLS